MGTWVQKCGLKKLKITILVHIFRKNLSLRDKSPWLRGGWCPGCVPSRQNSRLWL